MPCHNAAKYIKDSIESVLSQTFKDWELLIVDDCSSDNSVDVAASFADERIKIFKNEKNLGAALTRNVAIEKANGRYIAFLDADDMWDETKLEKQLAFMEENGYAFTYSHYYVLSPDGTKTEYKPGDSYSFKQLLKSCNIGCLTVIYDSEKLGKVFMATDAPKREDFATWLKILKTGEVAHGFPEPLATYRMNPNGVSSSKFKLLKYQYIMYRKSVGMNPFKATYYTVTSAVNKVLFKY